MSAFDAHAVLTSLRSFALLESTTGCVHYVAQPGTLTDVVVESVEHFIWAPKTLCGQIPPPRWLSISHLGDKNQSCRPCLARWHRLLWLFQRLETETHPADKRRKTP